MRTYTTSLRCGSSFSVKHNDRDPDTMKSEKTKEESMGLKFHIREDGEHKTLRNVDIKKAYEKLFGEALTEYNEKQVEKGHPERQIEDYYEHIKKDKIRNPAYEVIIQVGNKDNQVDDKTLKQIYLKYLNEWEKRNPNMKIFGAFYHNDEGTGKQQKGTAHLHIEYIPVAYQCKTGLKTQCNQKQAFHEMGIDGTKSRTAQMIWQERENNALQDICNQYGITIKNPKENAERLSRTLFALREQNQELQEENEALKEQNQRLYSAYQNFTANTQNIEKQLRQIDEKIQLRIENTDTVGLADEKEVWQLFKGIKENREELREISKQLKPTEHKKEESWGLDL